MESEQHPGVPLPDWPRLTAATVDPDRARQQLGILTAHAATELAGTDPDVAPLLAQVLAASPWMAEQLRRHPEWLPALFQKPVLANPRTVAELRAALAGGSPRAPAPLPLDGFRTRHAREHLRIGIRDLGRLGPVGEITAELSDLADITVATVLQAVANAHEERFGKVWHRDPNGRWRPTGFTVIALGKLGGRELNFSSDIDLMALYEDEEGRAFRCPPGPRSRPPDGALPAHEYFRQLATRCFAEIGCVTPEGQLYRVDLRLRPEGDAGPLARSLAGCESYYSQWGQTWERLMLLKARPVAGQKALGGDFLDLIQPFRHPRFPSEHLPTEIASAKFRLEREAAEGDADRDVKRGRGGIREIEFIAQALQVLHGGRQPFIQTPATLAALEKLADYGLLDRSEAGHLAEAYRFWRDIEHRLQMEDNRQTHSLPVSEAGRQRIAGLMGFRTLEGFEARRSEHVQRVRAAFERLLGSAGPAAVPGSGLPGDFTTAAGDWDTLLATHGFIDPSRARRRLQTFIEGPSWAHASARTGNFGRELARRLLGACRGSPFPPPAGQPSGEHLSDPDQVLTRLDRFVTAYGSRAPLYETWVANPPFFTLLAWLFDRSECLAETAIRVPDLVEDLVRTQRLRRARTERETRTDLGYGKRDKDQRLWIRRYQEAETLRIGLRSILGLADTTACQEELTRLADACIVHALDHLCRRHRLKSPPFAVMALGRLGGGEMTFGSDLDLLLVTGRRASVDTARTATLASELVDLLAGPTDVGRAYAVDFRLRPDGEAGPLVVSTDGLAAYLEQRARLWEIQALSRLRPVAGSRTAAREVLTHVRRMTDFSRGNPGFASWSPRWRSEIAEMLGRIHRQRTPHGRDGDAIKTGVGGLIDAEFIGRAWSLAQGWNEPGTAAALRRGADEGLVPNDTARALVEAQAELTRIELVLRRGSGTAEAELPADRTARTRVALRCGLPDADALDERVADAREIIRRAAGQVLT